MTDVTHARVLTFADGPAYEGRPSAVGRALSVFTEFANHRFYYHDAALATDRAGDPVVPFTSEVGQDRIAESLDRTRNRREHLLSELLEIVEDAESQQAAASEYDLFQTARKLGAYYFPTSTFLYDGTDWAFGDPILNTGRIDEIRSQFDPDQLYVVDVELTY